jgi:hypothetical protein
VVKRGGGEELELRHNREENGEKRERGGGRWLFKRLGGVGQ